MDKKRLAVAVSVATFGTHAVAVELYNNDGITFAVGGHVSVNLNGSEAGSTDVGSNSPRINIEGTQDLGNGFTVDAKGEWAINYLNNSENAFTTRLGYIGLTHEDLGRTVVGTQWAPYYDVAGVTDLPIAYANDFLYPDNFAKVGLSRADKMVSYRNDFSFGEAGALNFGLAWQGENQETNILGSTTLRYRDRTQASASYSVAGAMFGYGYNSGKVGLNANTRSLDFHVFSAKYGSYGNGLYVAGVYQMADNKYDALESDSYELLAAFGFANSLNLSINYETVEEKDKISKEKSTEREELALQAEYNFTPKFVGYTGYQFDLNSSNNRDTDDRWTIGARYYF